MNYQNHVIDPTYFWDAIEEFSFNYNIYIETGKSDSDEYGRRKIQYASNIIRGSLQSRGEKFIQSKEGNTRVKEYDFYCKSIYRVNIGDIIEYKNNYLRCDSINEDYDEMGVRSAHFQMVSLTSYRDLSDYIQYLRGQKLV